MRPAPAPEPPRPGQRVWVSGSLDVASVPRERVVAELVRLGDWGASIRVALWNERHSLVYYEEWTIAKGRVHALSDTARVRLAKLRGGDDVGPEVAERVGPRRRRRHRARTPS